MQDHSECIYLAHCCYTFNDPGRKNDFSNIRFAEKYSKVLNYLAVKYNRKLLDSMTPDNIPEVFHNVDEYYHMPLSDDYYERFDYKVRLPDTKDFNKTKEAIRNQLLENNLIWSHGMPMKALSIIKER